METPQKTMEVACVYCDKPARPSLLKTLAARGSKVGLVRCEGCGLVFLSPRLSNLQISDIYESDSLENASYYSETIEDDRKDFGARLSLVSQFLKKSRIVLDIGASVGTFLDVCRTAGFKDLYGVELNAESRKKAAELFSILLLPELPPEVKADLVNMSDVIEHLEDPVAYMKNLRQHLHNDSVVLITTPDFARWITHVVNIKPEEHLFYFTKEDPSQGAG